MQHTQATKTKNYINEKTICWLVAGGRVFIISLLIHFMLDVLQHCFCCLWYYEFLL